MKKLIYYVMAATLLCGCAEDVEKEFFGGINGIVSDKTTGGSVPTVNVSLTPGGKSAVTGSDGNYSFTDLEPGTYTINISKEGYKPTSKSVVVVAGKNVDGHILIERIPAIVTVDRDVLDFGDKQDVNTLSFSIVNSSYENLIWTIEQNCTWIKEVKPNGGTLKFEKTEAITIVIEREKLAGGNNETVVGVKSSNGLSELTVKAVGIETGLPGVTTQDPNNISATSAQLNGTITSEGLPAFTERGFVYATTPQPTLDNTIRNVTAPVNSERIFWANVEGLELNKTYYVRAYATNTIGTAYGNEVSFEATASLAGVTTQDPTNISATSAQLNGTITSEGLPAFTERGFVYATTPQPTLSNTIRNVTAPVNSERIFSANVEGLDLNRTYYVRAYATNTIGTAYGNEVSFEVKALPALNTIRVSEVTSSTAKFEAEITSEGSPAYTERGFVFATTSQPTLSNTIRKITAEKNSNTGYSASVSGLSLNTTYYVRAFATNDNGTAYGNEVTFTSGAELATLSTNAPADISTNSALLGGNIITTGSPAYNEHGVCYGVSPMPTIDNSIKVIIPGSGTGSFSQQVSGLSSGTKYYARAYAKSGDSGTAYGEEVSFTTHAPVSVNTQSVSSTNITTSSAKIYGNIINAGVPGYTEKGICYGTSNNPTKETAFSLSVAGSGTGAYSADINNLDANTRYYACAYATNELGTVYGNTVNFTTKLEKASVSTQAPSTLSGTSVRLNGTIISTGNPPYTERGFVCGMSSFPTVSDTKVPVSGEGAGTFSAIFNYGNDYIYSYHVRAYVINADKSVLYGEDYLFFFEVSF
jgi:hypothetical protein